MFGNNAYGTAAYGVASGAPAGPVAFTLSATVAVTVTQIFALGFFAAERVFANVGSFAATVQVQVFGANATDPAGLWNVRVLIDNADWSARLTGTIEIDAEEGAARIADLTLVPTVGAINLPAWVGSTVAIDFERLDATGAVRNRERLFTGLVDVPSFDPPSGLMRLRCTDALQDGAANLTRAQIDALTPAARWSAAVFDEAADGWTYLTNRMSTTPQALDRTPDGLLRVTDWAAKTVADLQLDDTAVLDETLAVDLPGRADLRNAVTANFTYRFPRLKRRVITAGYGYPFSYEEIAQHGYSHVTREMVRQAIDGTGWEVQGEINYVPRKAGPFALYFVGGLGVDFTSKEVADQLCMGFTARLQKRYAQSIDEAYSLVVQSSVSVARLGVVSETISGALEATFDLATWEKIPPKVPPGTEGTIAEPQPAPPAVITMNGETYVDYTGVAGVARADADAAQACLVAAAQTRVRQTHRLTRVKAAALLSGRYDLDKTLRIATGACTAKGKLARVRHVMDFNSGRAVSELELAISSTGAVGLGPAQSTPSPASVPAAVTPTGVFFTDAATTWVGQSLSTPLAGAPEGAVGFFTNVVQLSSEYDGTKPRYEPRFVLQTPEIPAANRDNLTLPVTRTYEAQVPEDELTVTAL